MVRSSGPGAPLVKAASIHIPQHRVAADPVHARTSGHRARPGPPRASSTAPAPAVSAHIPWTARTTAASEEYCAICAAFRPAVPPAAQ
ncbi:hypothetical protein OG389_09220 [Streptomyces sp. NBC_00435]|uniref:hypothetical protein n=1 Tax=Streptomyces sp. NBC_00435 TaxID=2903649 RepID=UPI002E22D998